MALRLFSGTLGLYTLMVLASVFLGGSIIRLYGETCGRSLFDPLSWVSSFMLIGSPWCRALNWVGHISTMVMEYVWFHLATVTLGWISTYIPSMIGGNPVKGGSVVPPRMTGHVQ
jgi:hypothetical protein